MTIITEDFAHHVAVIPNLEAFAAREFDRNSPVNIIAHERFLTLNFNGLAQSVPIDAPSFPLIGIDDYSNDEVTRARIFFDPNDLRKETKGEFEAEIVQFEEDFKFIRRMGYIPELRLVEAYGESTYEFHADEALAYASEVKAQAYLKKGRLLISYDDPTTEYVSENSILKRDYKKVYVSDDAKTLTFNPTSIIKQALLVDLNKNLFNGPVLNGAGHRSQVPPYEGFKRFLTVGKLDFKK